MYRRGLITAATAAPALAAFPLPVAGHTAHPIAHSVVGASLNKLLDAIRTQRGLPAIAACVVQRGSIIASGASGTRRVGTHNPVTINDRFHIGSDTKAMTALLAAMLVEQNALHWNSTIGAVFPELGTSMDAGLRDVTLEQLLSHTSGLPSDNEAIGKLFGESAALDGLNLDELRYWLLKRWSNQPLAAKPGTSWAYSNLGYTFAGAMLERTTRQTWEELCVARLFQPLGLNSAGFGPQASLGRVDAPLGHMLDANGTLKAMLAGPGGDNPAILGPAGTVHLSILDFAAWAGWNAGEGRRAPSLVHPESVRKLHTPVIDVPPLPNAPPGTPPRGRYCLGWGVIAMPYAREPFVMHNGSNTMNLAVVMLQPEHDFAMVLATNVGGQNADDALKDLAEQLYRRFGPARRD